MMKNLLIVIGLMFTGLAIWPAGADDRAVQRLGAGAAITGALPAGDGVTGRLRGSQADRFFSGMKTGRARHESTKVQSTVSRGRCAADEGRSGSTKTETATMAVAKKDLPHER